ncbi:ABC transporter ATP-binding protein [Xanthobacter tagetidis]|uniref:ATP-binding cassette domain-containing protein n=1 Tax=Xanthobacter tagetidis TaxID=60216 RepID=A0A3L7ANE6_9HYPH|nr:ATP-binding cassette domain-containing protein [Xanthobacter tagetidis]MBB6307603.1 NitT/TauT family transport system ATP-binding protein [Xanthobacter tagetidis]RLP81170.1 ATP-binding cassette domain-containing protein [Xanthobacter tagetidis]
MLRLDGVCLSFGDGPVLDGIGLAVPTGRLVALIGPSGCGKTTLLGLAAGALQPQAGRVENRFARTAMVFQEPRLLPWAGALDNAAFGLKAMGLARGDRRARARDILLRLGLTLRDLAKRPGALSGGMRQRVAIARALAVEPDLLLMDEPFSALDVGLRAELQALVRAEVERAGIAVLFVTHDVAEAVRLADRIVVLSPRPARVVADLASVPLAAPSAVFAEAARLLALPEVVAALAPPVRA